MHQMKKRKWPQPCPLVEGQSSLQVRVSPIQQILTLQETLRMPQIYLRILQSQRTETQSRLQKRTEILPQKFYQSYSLDLMQKYWLLEVMLLEEKRSWQE